MTKSRKPAKPRNALYEVVDFTPACDEPMLVCRGDIYAVYRQGGESDFIAGCNAFGGKAVDAQPTHGAADIRDYLTRNCGWDFEVAA